MKASSNSKKRGSKSNIISSSPATSPMKAKAKSSSPSSFPAAPHCTVAGAIKDKGKAIPIAGPPSNKPPPPSSSHHNFNLNKLTLTAEENGKHEGYFFWVYFVQGVQRVSLVFLKSYVSNLPGEVHRNLDFLNNLLPGIGSAIWVLRPAFCAVAEKMGVYRTDEKTARIEKAIVYRNYVCFCVFYVFYALIMLLNK